jgi:hypothetical protein
MKKLTRILISFAFIWAMVSCEKDAQNTDSSQNKKLKTTETGICTDETGWVSGILYLTKGNWAMFITTPPYASLGIVDVQPAPTINLMAGQNMVGGIAYLYQGPNGTVNIKINLEDCWSLQNVDEAFKIQGYAQPPLGVNPAPGQFTTYKGNGVYDSVNQLYIINVPYFPYYGIHVDLQFCCN